MVEVFVARLVRTANLDILNSAKRFCLTKLWFTFPEYTALCNPSRHTMLFKTALSVSWYGQPHGTDVRQLQMSVGTGVDEKTFVDFSLAISSLVKILVATDSCSRSLLSFKLSFIILSAA